MKYITRYVPCLPKYLSAERTSIVQKDVLKLPEGEADLFYNS